MLDIVLLRIMKYKADYEKMKLALRTAPLDEKTKILLDAFDKYFKLFPKHDVIDLQVFIPRFKAWNKFTDEQLSHYVPMIRQLQTDADEQSRDGILEDLHELAFGTHVANIVEQYLNGDLTAPLPYALGEQLDKYKNSSKSSNIKYDESNIEDLLREDLDDSGVRWRLQCLNEAMRPLRPGDFGIIAGRPDKGKTSFLASEMTHMAAQLPEDKNVVWINNEGLSGVIVKRCYQAALGKSIEEMLELVESKKLKKMYEKVVSRWNKIQIINAHEYNTAQIEHILENTNPGIVLYDMIDNIRGFESEQRGDMKLEEMYKWARAKCVKYNCIGLATSQISAEGKGLMYPDMSMLKDSKTGKQGACDFILMIGSSEAEHLRDARYLSLPKNKLRRAGAAAYLRQEVHFDWRRSRYKDVEILNEESNEETGSE